MLETVNSYIRYVYYLLGTVLFILFIVLLVRISKVRKALRQSSKGIDSINDKTKAIKEKTEYLKKSFSTSWAFFIEIIAVFEIIRIVIRDYKTTPREKRSMIKSSAYAISSRKHVARKAIRRRNGK